MTGRDRTIQVFKTAVFRLHNPSKRKCARLSDTMRRNHLAYIKILDAVQNDLDVITSMPERERTFYLRERALSMARALPLSSGAKIGLSFDIQGQIESHLELRKVQERASVPTAARLKEDSNAFSHALDELAVATDKDEEDAARDSMARAMIDGQARPLLFMKYQKKDGFLLLGADTVSHKAHAKRQGARNKNGVRNLAFGPNRKIYAWLNLHAKDSRFAEVETVDQMIDLRTGERVSFKCTTGALFPLAFGRSFQDQEFLQRGIPKTAKLVRRDTAWELHVTFVFSRPMIEPGTLMGFDRGIDNIASMTVIDVSGRVLAQRNFDGRHLRHVQRLHERRQREQQRKGRRYRSRSRRAMQDEMVHATANAIVETAALHRSQVVLEYLGNLGHSGKRRGRSNYNRLLSRAQYQKLQRILGYKLAVAGLPKIKEVSAARTSITCPRCGSDASANRDRKANRDQFSCIRCGFSDDADLNAARVIAFKYDWRSRLPATQRRKLFTEIPPEFSFMKFFRDRAEQRGEGWDEG